MTYYTHLNLGDAEDVAPTNGFGRRPFMHHHAILGGGIEFIAFGPHVPRDGEALEDDRTT